MTHPHHNPGSHALRAGVRRMIRSGSYVDWTYEIASDWRPFCGFRQAVKRMGITAPGAM